MANRIPSKLWKTIKTIDLFQVDQVCTIVHDTYTNNVSFYIHSTCFPCFSYMSLEHYPREDSMTPLTTPQDWSQKDPPPSICWANSTHSCPEAPATTWQQKWGFQEPGMVEIFEAMQRICRHKQRTSNEDIDSQKESTLKAINETVCKVCIAINRGVWPTPTVQGLQRSRYSVLPISRHLLNPHSMSMRHPMHSRYNLHCWGNFKNRDTVLH